MKFRNDISFLRALSVIAVLLYHFKFNLFKGGFKGVDVFFVISGYLMTRIILNGFSKGSFNYWEYLQKRISRIIPALLIMIIFFVPLIYFLIPIQFINYLRSFFSSSLFFSNIYYYLNSGYFDGSSQTNFLLHTWSLSVEWQFYMIYPLVLLLFRKTYLNNESKFKAIFLILIVFSFVSMLMHEQSYSFYIFYTRAWEMMFGGLAFLFEPKAKNISRKIKNILLIISLLLICGSITFINIHHVVWPSLYTLIPVISTTLILFLNLNWKIFGNKLIRFLGDISYSLYLWHWPFYVISMFFAMNIRVRHRIIFIVLSLFFATISYFLIEKKDYKKPFKIVLIAIIFFVVSISLTYVNTENIFTKQKSNLVFASSNYKNSNEAIDQFSLNNKYFSTKENFSSYNLNNFKIQKNKKYVLLIGDSHAGMFSKSLNNIIKDSHYNLLQVTADATYPMVDSQTNYIESKKFFNHFFKNEYPKVKNQIALVVINSNYNGYSIDQLLKKIDFTECFFNKKAIYLGITPTYPLDFPTFYYIKENYNIVPESNIEFEKHTTEINNILQKKLGYRYVNLLNIKINQVNNGMPYIYDQHHMTYYGTIQYENIIRETLFGNFLQ